MTTQDSKEPLKIGALVKFLNSGFEPGRIVEYRGPLAPGRVRVYRVRFGRKPSTYVEVREDQLEVLPDES